MSGRIGFKSSLGVILATAGSAVGLGNVWRFPYMAGQDGGASYIVVYILCVLVLGVPCMLAEFIIGRHAASNTARAYRRLGGRWWGCVGVVSVATGFLITCYYVIVSGWCLEYMWSSAGGLLSGSAASYKAYFAAFSASPWRPVVWAVVFMAVTHWVIIHGVRGGIERASKLLMPALFVLLMVIVVGACSLPGAERGVAFLLRPDWGRVTPGAVLDALGQSFYSLSIGMGCICTYASYFSRQTNLTRSAVQISVIDCLVAILAGLMIFPAAFSVGVEADSGPSLIFITLPAVFEQAFGGPGIVSRAVALAFYALMSLAALTSLISLHEVSTAFFQEELRLSRKRAAAIVSVGTLLVGTLCSLSLGGTGWLQFAGRSLFDLFDFVTGQVLLPLVGFAASLFIGWWCPKQIVRDELTNWGTLSSPLLPALLLCLRFVCPVGIAAVFVYQLINN